MIDDKSYIRSLKLQFVHLCITGVCVILILMLSFGLFSQGRTMRKLAEHVALLETHGLQTQAAEVKK